MAVTVAALALCGCRRAEVWLSPDATVELETSDHRKRTLSSKAGKKQHLGYPAEMHELTIRADGRATVRASLAFSDEACAYSTTANVVCPKAERQDRRGHPLDWLRQANAPFELPTGQGVLVTADEADLDVYVSQREGGTFRFTGKLAANTGRSGSLPLVIRTEPGQYYLSIGKPHHYAHSADAKVERDVYRWHHVQIGTKRVSEGGSGWMR